MANKNNKSDLVHFFIVSTAIIAGFFALAAYGYSLIDKKYFRFADAKVSGFLGYIECRLEPAPPTRQIARTAAGNGFLDSGNFTDKMDFSALFRCPKK